jgi:alpha-ketoglutaric semialdehyde dehydrogenase
VNFIGGTWWAALEGRTFMRLNPARPDDVVGDFPDSGPADAESAASSAAQAYPAWRETMPTARGEVLHRAGDLIAGRVGELAAALTREEGKPLALARGEVKRCADVFRYFAGEALRHGGTTLPSARPGAALSTRAEPLGPVLLITPFNFPFFIAALKLGAALAAGNTVVWKPSPHVPVSSVQLMSALSSAGLPDGVVNLVHGPRPELGQALVDDPAIRAISFTGSTAVGLAVGARAAARHIRVQQEMGGKNVLVIGPDVDLEVAARIAAEGTFGESGQKCTATGLVVVDRRRAGPLVTEVATVLSGMLMGDGARPGVDIGPLIDARARERAQGLLDDAVTQGATVALDGCPLAHPELNGGYFFPPRVVRLPDGPSPLRRTEAFAPIMSIVAADDVIETGLEAIADSEMGLSASVLTARLDLAHTFAQRAEAGLVNVNLPTTGVEYQAPFGGWNQSGGPFPEAGQTALDFFTRRKTIAFRAL